MKAGKWIRIGILAALVSGLLFFLMHSLKQVIKAAAPLWFGILIAYLLLPVVEGLDRKKLPRNASIVISFVLSMMLILVTMLWLIPIIIDNIKELTEVIPDLFDTIMFNLKAFIEKNTPEQWRGMVLTEIDNNSSLIQVKVTEVLYTFISSLPGTISFIFDVVLAWIISFYILRDRDQIAHRLKYFFPEKYREDMSCFFRDIHRVVLRFIQGQFFIALILSVIETLGLYIIGMPYAPFLGFIGGISNIIPYFGPYIGAVPAVVIALATSPWKALWTAVVFIIAQQLDNIFLSPKIMKGKLGLHPLTTIMAVIIGGRLFGFAGLLFSVPSTAMIKIVAKRVLRFVSG